MAKPTKAEVEATLRWLLAEKTWLADQLAVHLKDVALQRDSMLKIFDNRPFIG